MIGHAFPVTQTQSLAHFSSDGCGGSSGHRLNGILCLWFLVAVIKMLSDAGFSARGCWELVRLAALFPGTAGFIASCSSKPAGGEKETDKQDASRKSLTQSPVAPGLPFVI